MHWVNMCMNPNKFKKIFYYWLMNYAIVETTLIASLLVILLAIK